MSNTETISGRVEQVKESGFKIEGDWVSWSRFGAAKDVPHDVQQGELVKVTFDEKRFIQALSRPEGETPTRRSVYQEAETGEHDRGLHITRMACLKQAISLYALVAERTEVKEGKPSEVILKLATQFEKWVLRDPA